MFFIGQSGYLITLALTAFLPLFLLIAKPSSGFRLQERAEMGRTTYQLAPNYTLKASDFNTLEQSNAIWPNVQQEGLAQPDLKPKAASTPCCVNEPPQICKSNKAPPTA